jgi:hypothetical protein
LNDLSLSLRELQDTQYFIIGWERQERVPLTVEAACRPPQEVIAEAGLEALHREKLYYEERLPIVIQSLRLTNRRSVIFFVLEGLLCVKVWETHEATHSGEVLGGGVTMSGGD